MPETETILPEVWGVYFSSYDAAERHGEKHGLHYTDRFFSDEFGTHAYTLAITEEEKEYVQDETTYSWHTFTPEEHPEEIREIFRSMEEP